MPLFHHHKEPPPPPPPLPLQQAVPPPPSPSYRGPSSGFMNSGGGGGGDLASSSETALGFSSSAAYSPSGGLGIMYLPRLDWIAVLGFPQEVIPALTSVIERVWLKGIKQAGASKDGMAYEWKVHGDLWITNSSEGIPSRRLIMHILNCLANMGWHLLCRTNFLEGSDDKDTLIFRPGPPMARYFFAIGFHNMDKVWIIDPPNSQVQEAIIEVVRTWPKGVKEEKMKEQGCYALRMHGNLWGAEAETGVNATQLLCARLLSTMHELGYELVGSIGMTNGWTDQNMHSSGRQSSPASIVTPLMASVDTWFFAQKM